MRGLINHAVSRSKPIYSVIVTEIKTALAGGEHPQHDFHLYQAFGPSSVLQCSQVLPAGAETLLIAFKHWCFASVNHPPWTAVILLLLVADTEYFLRHEIITLTLKIFKLGVDSGISIISHLLHPPRREEKV